MSLILQSVGINYEFSEYSTIIQNALHTLKHNHDNDTSINDIDDNEAQFDNNFQILEDNQIDQMLLQYQRRITMKCNFLNHLNRNQLIIEDEFGQEFQLNSTDNSFFDIIICNAQKNSTINRLFIMQKMEETRAIFDQYTQKEHRKFNNKTTNNQKNFVVETDNGSIELAAALRYERMYAGIKPIRTKGRASRWTTACKKVFEITKLNPQSSKFKAGNYFFIVDKTPLIFIAEIIAVFV
ncbi:15071_t:CDS:2, partial [Gigaspora rosea]